MNPAFSVIIFTTLSGAAQGLVLSLALAVMCGALPQGASVLSPALMLALAMLSAGLVASFFHLGHPERAWRAAMMWRTSWLSREVIVLPAFMGAVAWWWFAIRAGSTGNLLPLLCIALAMTLWLCTGMIYACIRFIQEWAHPLTLINFALMGLSSGLILTGAMATLAGNGEWAHRLTPWALVLTAVAWASRTVALRRNASLVPRSTLQSATGIRAHQVKQQSMGMSAGSFNTREFFHQASPWALKQIKWVFQALSFAAPMVCLLLAMSTQQLFWLWLAVAVQAPGLVAERWFFFAQARHPQNLYYAVVS